MNAQTLDKLFHCSEEVFKDVFLRGIKPLKMRGRGHYAIVGFDTEYDSNTAEIVSYQFSYGLRTHFEAVERRLSAAELDALVRKIYRIHWRDTVFLISFFSHAEIFQTSDWLDNRVRPVHPSGVSNMEYSVGHHRKLVIYDIWHLFNPPMALEKVAEGFGLQKKEYDTTNVHRNSVLSESFRSYAVHDALLCEKIFHILDESFSSLGADLLRYPTAAGASMAAFRNQYVGQQILAPHWKIRAAALQAYWGGRVELYRHKAKGKLVEIDADSLYPRSAILLDKLPGPDDWLPGIPTEKALGGFGLVTFSFPKDCQFPCLPVWVDDVGLCFPLAGHSHCTLAEIREAIKLGASIEWGEFYYYEHGSYDQLAIFLRKLLEIKERASLENNAGLRSAAKLMLNSVIGKFGQHKAGFDLQKAKAAAAIDFPSENIDNALKYFLSGVHVSEQKLKFSADIRFKIGSAFYPEWACLILGMARAVMADCVARTRPLTVSTDSVIVADKYALSESLGIPFKRANEGDNFVGIRPRLYLLESGSRTTKLARHSLHLPYDKAANLIREGSPASYTRTRIPGYRDVATGTAPLVLIASTMRFDPREDQKRIWKGNCSYPIPMVNYLPDGKITLSPDGGGQRSETAS